ncbi:hypothetical protein [Paenibacillus daejeonensis]|uniref:hypothetical protein n=1 Tax=Paenibacillus daejeonensis TaxID=135193 RepID=UPI00036C2073|nr:hypothetical protein [Paenibacillus daejeonensis]
MNFKLQTQLDNLTTFLNPNEFGELHDIDGVPTMVVIDQDLINKRSQVMAEGTYINRLVLFVRMADLGYIPVEGQMMRVDDSPYLVVQVGHDMGILSVTLEGNQT